MPEDPKVAAQPATSTGPTQPRIPIPSSSSPRPQPMAQTAMPQPSHIAPATGHQPICPQCGATIDLASGRCPGCGLLFGSKHRVMQQSPAPSMSQPASPPLTPRPQIITDRQSPGVHDAEPRYNYPAHSIASTPSFGHSPNYGSPPTMPYSGMQPMSPRPVPVAAGTVPAPASAPVQSMPYQPVSAMPREGGVSPPARRSLARIMATLFALIICFFLGTGIYYVINQARTPSQPNFPATSTPGSIRNIAASSITETDAVITWTTNAPATSQVEYGKTEACELTTPLNQKLAKSHSVTLTDLNPNTTYYFKPISQDASGNEIAVTTNQTFKTLPVIGCEKGNRAPDFKLPDIDGKTVRLSDYRGKIVMVNFWATWCVPCTEEMPLFQAVSDDLTILAINKEETRNKVRSELTGKNYTFTILLDSDGTVNALYNVNSLPTTFLINADGIIKEIKEERFQDQAEIENILKSL